MANRFQQQRLQQLFGIKKQKPSFVNAVQPKTPQNSSSRKAILFRDYKYLHMEMHHGNRIETRSFACFKDEECFDKTPLLKEVEHDNDYDSDEEQVKYQRKRMVAMLQEQIENHKNISDI